MTWTNFKQITCGGCGIVYKMPMAVHNARYNDGLNFHCPNGCVRCYRPSGQAKRILELEAQLQRVVNQRDWNLRRALNAEAALASEVRRRCAYQGQVARWQRLALDGIPMPDGRTV